MKIIALGGAKNGGNVSPVAEYNFWQDPEAASIVLTNALSVTMVPLDAFTMPTVDLKDVDKLAAKGNAAAKALAPALRLFVDAQNQQHGARQYPGRGRCSVCAGSQGGHCSARACQNGVGE